MTHAKPIPMVITALYQKDVRLGDMHSACHLFCLVLNLCEALKQNNIRVKSGNFGHQVNSDSDLVRFISHLDFHCLQTYVRIYLMSEVTRPSSNGSFKSFI